MSFDVKTAFLHAKLSTVIFCKQIPGFPEADSSTVLHLLVTLYGLKQSLYKFYMLLRKLMTCLGMTHCEVDHAVFYGSWSSPLADTIPMPSNGNNLILMVPIHVDDGLAITNSIPLYTWFLHQEKREMEILGNGKKILGISLNYHYYSIMNFCRGPWEITRNLECISDGFLCDFCVISASFL